MVPVTSDLAGYEVFWTRWILLTVATGGVWGLSVLVILIEILRSCWRREMRELKS